MESYKSKIYPSASQAIMLLVIALLIEVVVNLPLSVYDYFKGTDYLFNKYKSFILVVALNAFVLIYGIVRSKDAMRNMFPSKRFPVVVVLLVFLVVLLMQRFIIYINSLVIAVIPVPAWFEELFSKVLWSEFGFAGQAVRVAIFAPVVEELIFRGVIMRGLLRKYSPFFAIVFSALLFAAYHLNPWQFSVALYLGLFLGWLRYKTRNIWLPIAAHALNNFIVLVGSSDYQTDSMQAVSGILEMPSDIQCAVAIVLSVALLLWVLWKYPKTDEVQD
ncbi:MAG: lysostaphin resistance A-like protein [Bacteroidales bacterium]